MKLLMVSTYPPDSCGIGDYTAGLCSVLRQRFSIDVLTYALPGKKQFIEEEENLRIHRVLPRWAPPRDVLRLIRHLKPEVVHIQTSTFLHHPRLYLVARGLRGRPLLATVHDTPVSARETPWRILVQNLYDNSTRLIVHSFLVLERLRRDYRISSDKILYFPHGVDSEKFSPNFTLRPIRAETPINFGFFGFILPGKGLEALLKAFALALPEMPNSHLTVVGGNGASARGALLPSIQRSYRETLTDLANSLQIRNNVTFTGFVEYSDLDHVLSNIDVFVLPYEGSPTASGVVPIVLSLGRPLICSRVAYFENLLTPDLALFVAPNNVEDLAAAMIQLFSNLESRERLGDQARLFANRTLSWQAQVETIASIYHQVGSAYLNS